jgi:hypothetical protein
MPGGPQGGQGGGDGLQRFTEMYQQQRGGGNLGQQRVDEANMALQMAQLSGANPMQIAQLGQAAMQAQRALDQSRQQQYAQQMSDRWEQQQGGGTIGTAGRGGGQQPQNPYFQMLLQSQLGGGGGGRGGESYGRGGMPGGY